MSDIWVSWVSSTAIQTEKIILRGRFAAKVIIEVKYLVRLLLQILGIYWLTSLEKDLRTESRSSN